MMRETTAESGAVAVAAAVAAPCQVKIHQGWASFGGSHPSQA